MATQESFQTRVPKTKEHKNLAAMMAISGLCFLGFLIAAVHFDLLKNGADLVFTVSLSIAFIFIFISSSLAIRADAKRKFFMSKVLEILVRIKADTTAYGDAVTKVAGIENVFALDVASSSDRNKYKVVIYTTQPGILIGRKGSNIKKLHSLLRPVFGYDVLIEVHGPDLFKNLYK